MVIFSTTGRRALAYLIFFFFLPVVLVFSLLQTVVPTGGSQERISGSKSHEVVVLAYSSFLHAWGPGPDLARLYEQKTGNQIKWIDGQDSALLIERYKLIKNHQSIDVILGLDQFALPEARRTLTWKTNPLSNVEWHRYLPSQKRAEPFVPFDWSPMTFVYRPSQIAPPQKLSDLLEPRFKNNISLQDPRTSTPGYQFLNWVLEHHGDAKGFKFLSELKPQVSSLAPSWSTSYEPSRHPRYHRGMA